MALICLEKILSGAECNTAIIFHGSLLQWQPQAPCSHNYCVQPSIDSLKKANLNLNFHHSTVIVSSVVSSPWAKNICQPNGVVYIAGRLPDTPTCARGASAPNCPNWTFSSRPSSTRSSTHWASPSASLLSTGTLTAIHWPRETSTANRRLTKSWSFHFNHCQRWLQ